MSPDRTHSFAVNQPRVRRVLRVLDALAVALTVLALGVGFYIAYRIESRELLRLSLTLFIPFILVSVLRRIINAPRPAELCGDGTPSGRRGGSFPSRHAHSAFSIGTALLFLSVPLGAAVLALGVCLGACRVLLGLHFPRDVIAGALTGSVTAVIGMLIL